MMTVPIFPAWAALIIVVNSGLYFVTETFSEKTLPTLSPRAEARRWSWGIWFATDCSDVETRA